MKADLKRILNETNVEKFVELTEKYFERLQNADEPVFLNYLKKYIFCIVPSRILRKKSFILFKC